jgi:hypothetical protein
MSRLHPEILMHCTGRRLPVQAPPDDAQCDCVELLRGLYADGLRFSVPAEPDIVAGLRGLTVLRPLPILCFTEARLQHADAHAKRFGRLGIGFHRELLMPWGANPVFYMQSRDQGIVNSTLADLAKMEPMPRGLEVFLSYVKPMGDPCSGDMPYYDEMEWRMVAEKVDGRWPDRLVERDGCVWFPFRPEEVALLIFPDEPTRRKALADAQLSKAFDLHTPMLLDAADCRAL